MNVTPVDTVDIPMSETVTVTTIYIILIVLGFLGNLSVIITMLAVKKFRRPQNILIVNLSVSDFMVTVGCLPQTVGAMVARRSILGFELCELQGAMIGTSCVVSLFSITAIAINRYISICQPGRYKKIYTKLNTGLMIAGIWVYATLITIPPLFGWGAFGYEKRNYTCTISWRADIAYTLFLAGNLILIAEVIVAACYYAIFKAVRKSAKRIEDHKGRVTVGEKPKKRDDRVAIQLFIIYIAYNVCWGPYLITAAFVESDHFQISMAGFFSMSVLIVLNSCCNPPIYFFMNRQFREAITSVFPTCKCCARNNISSVQTTVATTQVGNAHPGNQTNNTSTYESEQTRT